MNAISPGDIRVAIDPEACTECYGFFGESQCVVVCPTGAISIDKLEPRHVLASRFRRLNRDREMQDTSIWRRIGFAAPGSGGPA
jgi:ferredoxin